MGFKEVWMGSVKVEGLLKNNIVISYFKQDGYRQDCYCVFD